MRKLVISAFFVFSVVCAALASLWLVLITHHLITTGATYSRTVTAEDGSNLIICGISIFNREDWLWSSFELFGVQILILIASIRTAQVLYRRLF